MKVFSAVLVAATLLSGGCSLKQTQTSAPSNQSGSETNLAEMINAANAPTFSNLNANVIQKDCYICHMPTLEDGGFLFDNYKDIMASNLIVPGNAEASPFCTVLINHGLPSTAPVLTNDEILEVCNWIQSGAADD